MAVYLIGTLDTKAEEVAWVRERLRKAGLSVTVIDAGCLGEAGFAPDISRQQVCAAADADHASVAAAGDRGSAVTLAAEGVRRIITAAAARVEVDGVLALGGSAGTTIGTTVMRDLPLNVPKIMVSTMASGQTRPYVGGRNIFMLNSVTDIAGINRISRTVLSQAAAAMIGMLQTRPPETEDASADRPLIAATMFGVTTPCVLHARKLLEDAGFEVLVFHATGSGGEAMEGLIKDGLIAGVLDITTTELADELVGGILSAGPTRLTAAAAVGVPQVVSVGALDMVNFGPPETVPDRFRDRTFYRHNPTVTLMRTTPDENRQLGQEIGRKLSASAGPVTVLFPAEGVSAIDADGQPFHDPVARTALWQGLQSACKHNVVLQRLESHINQTHFAETAATSLLQMLKSTPTRLRPQAGISETGRNP
ncbi:MAG: Tm-1-like ATP-binding domain-containing protein [Planctomycetaceae bacterium]|nr:Tm-1-like ATP-binding domain-containing protein [Planctomycetaceae bacterium]